VTPGTVDLALLAAAGTSYFVSVDFNGCFGATYSCAIDNTCATGPTELIYFDNVIVSGGGTTFDVYFDPGCSATHVGQFFWPP
jgi:hypothetical protein